MSSQLSSKVALFNAVAQKHIQGQAINPFSNDNSVGSLPKPNFSKEEYGRPVRGSLSEARGLKANLEVCKEMFELCEIIDQYGERLFTPEEKPDDPRMVISFGELFDMYTVISSKLVGILLRARKHKLLDFEGECLFQRRDDHVPVFLLKPIDEIREILHQKPAKKPMETHKSSSDEEPTETNKSSDEEPTETNNASIVEEPIEIQKSSIDEELVESDKSSSDEEVVETDKPSVDEEIVATDKPSADEEVVGTDKPSADEENQ